MDIESETYVDVGLSVWWEAELRDRASHLHSVIDNSLCFIGVLDLNGVLLEANATAIAAAGIQRSDVIGKEFAECYWWSYGDPSVTEQLRDAIRRAKTGEIVRYDVVVRMAENSRMAIDFMLSPVRGPDGQVTHLIPSGVDISARKRAEQTAIEQTNQLNLALESGRMGIWIWDIEKDQVTWSKQLHEIFGERETKFDSTRECFLRAVYPEDREPLESSIRETIERAERNPEFEFRVLRSSDQKILWIHCRGTILLDAKGNPTKMVSVAADITDRKTRELNFAFFVELESRFAKRLSSQEIMEIACSRIAEHMQLSRCLLVEIDEQANTANVFFENSAEGIPSILGKHPIASFHSDHEQGSFFTGQPIIIPDTQQGACSSAQEFAKLGVGALVNSCFVSEERVRYVLSAIKETKYDWLDVDIKFLHDAATSVFTRFARARAEELLKESQDRLSMALASARMGSYDWEPETDCVLWDEQHLAITGLSQRKMKGRDFLQLVHPEDVEANKLAIERTLRGEGDYDTEFRIIRTDGQVRWLAAHGKIVRFDDGRPMRFVGLNWDITDRKQSELTIKLNEARLRNAAAAAGFAMLHGDFEQGDVTFSAEIRRLIGLPEDAPLRIESGLLPDWIHPEDRLACDNHIRKSIQQKEGTSISLDHRIVRADGEIRWMRLHSKPIYTGQGEHRKPTQWIGTMLDITQQRKFEESLKTARQLAESANESKSLFLANMSHEIRTPMTAILGFAELLEDDGLDSDPVLISNAVQTIRTNATHLLSVINDILDMSKIEAGCMTVEEISLSPTKLLDEIQSLLAPRAKGKGIELKIVYDSLMPEQIYSDPTRLRQILINLIGNAIKFTEIGSVAVHTSYFATTNRIQFRVVDTGVGMTAKQLEVVSTFQAFTQADASTTRQFGGTGLGLRISNTLAQLLGGFINVESSPGKGSVFTVTIETKVPPVSQSNEAAGNANSITPPKSDSSMTTTEPLAGMRILVAEDGPDNQKLISFHLKKAGAEVVVAENGLVAAEFVEQKMVHFDLVLMDMQMPVLDGYQTTQRLRAGGYKNPIVALTAHALETDRRKCLDAGCDAFATKPINRNDLIALAQRYGLMTAGG